MENRNLSLAQRVENTREPRPSARPVHFSVHEISSRFLAGIDEVRSQITLASELEASGNTDASKSMLRAQIVTAEGLLDFYIHEMSKYCLYEMFQGNWKKTEKYKNLKIPLLVVEEAIDSAHSQEWFFEHINNEFSSACFLGSNPMKEQLNLIGITYNKVIETAFPSDSKEERKHYVDKLFARRNAIAHQNDRDHATALQNDIDEAFVREYVRKVEAIGIAIHSIAESINSSVE